MRRVPKAAAYVIAPLPHTLGYVVAPVFVARSGKRHGWVGGRPRRRHLLGLVPLSAGAGLITWAIASHYRASPAELDASLIPTYLVQRGAYQVTRNPMYLGGAAMWLGWACLFGSARVLAAGAALFGGIGGIGVPFEERLLHDRFGSSYDAYCDEVPRWLRFGD